jgi:polar amino acid transport system substrate-binding protein
MIRTVFLVLTLLLVPWDRPSADMPTLRIAYIEFAPYYYTDDAGLASGYLIDLATLLVEELGYRPEFRSYPPRRVVRAINRGEVDLWLGQPAPPELDRESIVSTTMIDTVDLCAYRLRPLPAIRQREDLRGRHIVVLRGYGYGGWIEFIDDPANGITTSVANGHEQALRLLAGRDLDYLLDYCLPVAAALRRFPLPTLEGEVVLRLPVHMLVSPAVPDGERLMARLEAAFHRLGDRNPLLARKRLDGPLPSSGRD